MKKLLLVMSLLAITFITHAEFPHRIGGPDEIRQAIEMLTYVSQEGGLLREVLLPRERFRGCESQFYFENLSRFYDGVASATREATATCLQGHDHDKDKLRISMDLTYKMNCYTCQDLDSPYRQAIVDHLNVCLGQAKQFFSRYDLEVDINPIYVPFNEPLIDHHGKQIGTKYTWNGVDLLINSESDEYRLQGDNYWDVRQIACPFARSLRERDGCQYGRACMKLTQAIAKKLGMHDEGAERPRVRETSPYSMLDRWLAYATWENIELYPRHIRQLCEK